MEHLTAVCLTVAGWLRYLLAVDDEGKPFSPSSDPRLSELQDKLHEIRFGDPQSVCGRLSPILSDESLFGLNLCETPLAVRIEEMLMEELAGPGSGSRSAAQISDRGSRLSSDPPAGTSEADSGSLQRLFPADRMSCLKQFIRTIIWNNITRNRGVLP